MEMSECWCTFVAKGGEKFHGLFAAGEDR
jgi:hypothetical protein